MLYFTSDTHYGHKNMCKGDSDWTDKSRCRDFYSTRRMNEAIVDAINTRVLENDTLYHLGDWSFGGIDNIWEFRDMINCKNIHLILGNHDKHIEMNTVLPTVSMKRGEDVFARDIFSSVSHYKELKVNGQLIIMCHYAMRVWNKSHRGSWMLYGHSHGTLEKKRMTPSNPTWVGDDYFAMNYKTMDVGVDTNHLRPYSMSELKDIMDVKEVLLGVDHHGKDTDT